MTVRPVVLRERARRDIDDATDYYARKAGATVALGFIDEIEKAMGAIARTPAAGSPRYAYELDLPDLRTRSLKRYPYLVFYIERENHIDVWRVLHAVRDIPAGMRDSEIVEEIAPPHKA
jgi:toxin ParE1/3/4